MNDLQSLLKHGFLALIRSIALVDLEWVLRMYITKQDTAAAGPGTTL